MADTKISALPAGGAAVGADEYAVNRAGVTMKVNHTAIIAAPTAALAAHIAVTGAAVHGSSVATANDRLVHRGAGGDADATAFNAAAGAAGTPSHTFTADPNTGHYNYAADELGIATAGAHRAHWNTTGAVILNDAAASSKMTGPGITIQQGAYDDEAAAFQSTDVAQPFTAIADADTYGTVAKASTTQGGLGLSGFRDAGDNRALDFRGYLGANADTTKTAAGRAIIEARGYITDGGTGVGNTNADGNVFGVRTQRGGADVTLLLVDEDGDLHVLNDIVVAGVVDTIDMANHVHTGGAMGPLLTAAGITDRTRKFLVMASGGWNDDLNSPLHCDAAQGWELIDNDQCTVYGQFMIPEDFSANMTATAVVISTATANLRSGNDAEYGECAELWNLNTDSVAQAAIGVTINEHNCIQPIAMTPTIDDIVHLAFNRNGSDVLDTINGPVWFVGWIIEYTADS